MTTTSDISRRRFVATSWLSLAALATRSAGPSTGLPARPQPSIVFDPRLDISVRFASAAGQRGCACHAMHDDPYRFVRALLAAPAAPPVLAGIGTYADFILLTGTLQESRYRLAGHGMHSAGRPARHQCHGELHDCVQELRRNSDFWPEVLATYIATTGSTAQRLPIERHIRMPHDDAANVSWLMKLRSKA